MTRRVKWLLIALVLPPPAASPAEGGPIAAASCARADVQTAIDAAVDGDTVVIPSCAGGASWTTAVTISKGITVQGAGIGRTVLLDEVPKGDRVCGGASPMIRIDVAEPKRWRFTGVTIRGRAPDAMVCSAGHIVISGTSKAWRLDHVRLDDQQTIGIKIYDHTYGVIDHTEFRGAFKQGVVVQHDSWGGHQYGDGSWAERVFWGTEKAVYIEDCTFTDTSGNPAGAGAVDSLGGGRYVFRYNTAAFMGNHGTDSGGRQRGVRSYEIYNNQFNAGSLAIYTAINLRGGTGVIYNNTFTGDYGSIVNVQNFRDTTAYAPWGQCNGTSPYDQNLPAEYGYACLDQVGRSTGKLLSNESPVPAAWPDQALEPLYQWNNTAFATESYLRRLRRLLREWLYGPTEPKVSSSSNHIRANRDYFDHTVKPGYTAYPYPHPLTRAEPQPARGTARGEKVSVTR